VIRGFILAFFIALIIIAIVPVAYVITTSFDKATASIANTTGVEEDKTARSVVSSLAPLLTGLAVAGTIGVILSYALYLRWR
jgi:ABC-type uncharacterized transport system permease subunit